MLGKFRKIPSSFLKVWQVWRAVVLEDLFRTQTFNALPSGDVAGRLANPSIVEFNGRYLIAVREVNYVYDNGGRPQYLDGSNHPSSKCWLYELNLLTGELGLLGPLLVPEHLKSLVGIGGLEDPRLFVRNGDLFAIWTIAQYDGLVPEKNVMAIGKIDGLNLISLEVIQSPTGSAREKNWMPLVVNDDLYFLYDLSTMAFYKLVDNELHLKSRLPYENLGLSGHSGSSQLIRWGDQWICISHKAVRFAPVLGFEIPIFYMHFLIHIGSDLAFIKKSRPFFFRSKAVEFCGGACMVGHDLLMSYGVNDSAANVVRMSVQDLISIR